LGILGIKSLGDILNDFSREACCDAITFNLLSHWRLWAKTEHIKMIDTDELFLIDTGITEGMSPSGVWYANLKSEKIEGKIGEVVEYFTSQKMPFSWFVNETSKPEDLGEHLKANNFNRMDGTPGMAVELHKMIDDRPKPSGLTIERVNDEKSMRLMYNIWWTGYPMPEYMGNLGANIGVDLGFEEDNPIKYYIGYLDGKPAGCSYLVLDAGVAGLHGVVTLPWARGRGVGTEMSLHPLREARELGYRIGVLDATQQGIGIYRRVGFEVVSNPSVFTYPTPEQKAVDKKMQDFMHSKRK
jgi:GNAT superfamily N-acetyltransferase